MTDKDIIKALECCGINESCAGCPLCDDIDCCEYLLLKQVLDLINRLQEENERLKAEQQMADGYADALVEYTKEKAIKEFAERLKELTQNQYWYDSEYAMQVHKEVVSTDVIDNLVKEMVGEQI